MRVAVLSPHRDDAAFSCGLALVALVRAGATVTIVNVFTRSDYAVDLASVTGNDPGVDAVSEARLREDIAFVAALTSASCGADGAVTLQDLGRLDAPLRLAVPTENVLTSPLTHAQAAEQASELAAALKAFATFDMVMAPLALGDHIDHRIVRDAAVQCVPRSRLYLYEDLPYAARMEPEMRDRITDLLLEQIFNAQFESLTLCEPTGAHLKYSFAMQYPTQIAPEVATEMARYGAAGQVRGAAAERCFVSAECAGRLASFLGASASAMQWRSEPGSDGGTK